MEVFKAKEYPGTKKKPLITDIKTQTTMQQSPGPNILKAVYLCDTE